MGSCAASASIRRTAASTADCAWLDKRNTTMAGVFRGWICVNVRKIEIKRDEHSAFASANIYNTLIRLTAERLRDNRMRVVAFDCE